ncbi:MAG: SCO family protein [Halothiobacillus sp.]|jgi:protein SCO1/2|uniref:SCO family protein n=1 Tax=Halothiobacillus sp. TaxID=1891311 RepID=UPI002AD426AE|nr:SCO family protein [Halothiobacillus sp.]MDA3875461.1 SCO family protein [Halothiobacillus sp.]
MNGLRLHCASRWGRPVAILLLISLVGVGHGWAVPAVVAGDVNTRPVDVQRLAGFRPDDLLVFRALTSPIVVPGADFVSAQGPVQMPALFRNHWTLLYIGYTFCPDVCPTELTTLSGLLPELKKTLPDVHWQVVFLSVDPERDHPKRLAEYAHYFDPAFLGITGSRSMIDRVTHPLKAGYRIHPHAPGSMIYDVDHDTAYRLISPDGRMVAILPSPHEIAPMDRALVRFFKEVVQ